jgi:tetratricopeptide (TPR) repeat protein
MRKILLLLFLLSLSQHSLAQDQQVIDSLQNILKILTAAKTQSDKNNITTADTVIADILHQLAREYAHNDPGKSLNYADQTLKLSEKIGYKKGCGNAYVDIGKVNSDKGDYIQSIDFLKRALKIYREIGYNKGIAICYSGFGFIYWRQSNYPEALKNELIALKTAEKAGDETDIANYYNLIGVIYIEQASYKEALENLNASLKTGIELNDKKIIECAYNNIGIVYQNQGNNDEALKNLLLSLKYSKETGDNKRVANSYIFIANFYISAGNYSDGLTNCLSALKIHEETGDKIGIASSCLSLGIAYTRLQNSKNASHYLYKALFISKELCNPDLLKNCYKNLAELDSLKGDFKQALEHYKMYINLRDSIYNRENTKKLVQSQMQFDFEKKEDSLNQKQIITETKLNAEKKQKYFYWAGLSLLAILSFFVFLNFRNQKKINRLAADAYTKERTELELQSLRAQLNPHFIFNCINSIDAFIHSNDKYNATVYLNKFARLLRNILDSSKLTTVSFAKDMDTLKLYVELEELRHEKKFSTVFNIDEELLNNDYNVPALIIQPFVENAILHGLKNREDNSGLLQIEIKKIADKIEYSIKDNGIGRKAAGLIAQNKESSYGMQMSYDRIKLFNREEKPSVEITDLYKDGIAAGTEVKVLLNIV